MVDRNRVVTVVEPARNGLQLLRKTWLDSERESHPSPDRPHRPARAARSARHPRREPALLLARADSPAVREIGRASCRERVWMAEGEGAVEKKSEHRRRRRQQEEEEQR